MKAQPASVVGEGEIGRISFVGQGVAAQVEPAGFSGTLGAVSSLDVTGHSGSAVTTQQIAELPSEDRALIENEKAVHLLPQLARPHGVTDEMFPGVAAVLAKQLREDHEKRREDRRQEEGRNHDAEQRGKDRITQIVVTVIAAILAFVAGRLTN